MGLDPDRPPIEDEDDLKILGEERMKIQLRREFDMSAAELEKTQAVALTEAPRWLGEYKRFAAYFLATTLNDALRADPSQASPKPARSRSSRPRAPALDEGQSFARMVAECMKGPNNDAASELLKEVMRKAEKRDHEGT